MSDPEDPVFDQLSRMEALTSRLEIATARAEVLVGQLASIHESRPALSEPAPEEPRTLSQILTDNALPIILGLTAAAFALIVAVALF